MFFLALKIMAPMLPPSRQQRTFWLVRKCFRAQHVDPPLSIPHPHTHLLPSTSRRDSDGDVTRPCTAASEPTMRKVASQKGGPKQLLWSRHEGTIKRGAMVQGAATVIKEATTAPQRCRPSQAPPLFQHSASAAPPISTVHTPPPSTARSSSAAQASQALVADQDGRRCRYLAAQRGRRASRDGATGRARVAHAVRGVPGSDRRDGRRCSARLGKPHGRRDRRHRGRAFPVQRSPGPQSAGLGTPERAGHLSPRQRGGDRLSCGCPVHLLRAGRLGPALFCGISRPWRPHPSSTQGGKSAWQHGSTSLQASPTSLALVGGASCATLHTVCSLASPSAPTACILTRLPALFWCSSALLGRLPIIRTPPQLRGRRRVHERLLAPLQ